MKTIFVLIISFFRSGVLVLRREHRTTALVFDKVGLLGIIPAIGAGILFVLATNIPHVHLRYFLSAWAIVLLIAAFCAFTRVTITSHGVSLKFIVGLFRGKLKSSVYSGGCFSHNPGAGGEILYNEPQEVIPGRLIVPVHFYAFFPRQVANVLNEEILRVSGSSVPKAIVASSKETAS